MAFLGVLFYMELVDKGEYSNYWGRGGRYHFWWKLC
jgi:hypothetical protein